MTSQTRKNSDSFFRQEGLFTSLHQPLAERLRPRSLSEVMGQDHLLGEGGLLQVIVANNHLPSLIFWGAPGCGKTTLAQLLAHEIELPFVSVSAVMTGLSDLKRIFADAQSHFEAGRSLVLFVDEIHRFHRGQQDAFLPHIERGSLTLLGATTENPSFELNSALLSRCQVVPLKSLGASSLEALLRRAEEHQEQNLPVTQDGRQSLLGMAGGDGRFLLNMAEMIWQAAPSSPLDSDSLTHLLSRRSSLGDKGRDVHYNLASALHKSLRASDADGALYWLARMVEAGESHDFIARRLVRFASEDVGLSDPQALPLSLAAWDSWRRLGVPEGELALAGCVLYLSTAAKSNASYRAWQAAQKIAQQTSHLSPPKHILNAPTDLMKIEGYGEGYVYDHDADDAFSGQNCFPNDMKREAFYHPVERGYEREIKKRLAWWQKRRRDQ